MFAIVTLLVLIAIALLILCGIANIFLFRKMGLPGWWGGNPDLEFLSEAPDDLAPISMVLALSSRTYHTVGTGARIGI